MPDRSGTWEIGFPAFFAEHPEINPSAPNSHTADQQNRFRIFRRPPTTLHHYQSSLPSALINLTRRPTLPPLREGLTVAFMTSPGWRLFRFQPRFTNTGGEFASRIQCLTLPLSSLASKPIST